MAKESNDNNSRSEESKSNNDDDFTDWLWQRQLDRIKSDDND